jgi:hypothetical protein
MAHCYVLGKSGVGKSTFLENHALENEGGFAFLDPHGDSAEKLADTIDCIFWEPSDTAHIIGFNVLENVPEPQRHLVAAQVVSSFKAIWGDSWGPRLEWILYNSVSLLLDNSGSLLDIPKLLTDNSFQSKCLRPLHRRLIRNPTDHAAAARRNFWLYEFDALPPRERAAAIGPVLNKVGQLAANPVLSGILRHNTIDISRIMNRGQRLVVNLSKGQLGEEPSHLLGALLVAAFAQAAEGRAVIPFEERRPFTLYVDEFQNFATDSFSRALSEARKYRLELVLAHQYLGQLSDTLRLAVLGNVGRTICFRVGPEDAEALAPIFGLHVPTEMGHDSITSSSCEFGLHSPRPLIELPRFEAWERVDLEIGDFKTAAPVAGRGRLAAVRRRTWSRYTVSTRAPFN